MSNASAADRTTDVVRHRGFDRLGHWLMAACVLTLLITAFAPILGIEFAWVDIHWMTGVALSALVLIHIVRASLFGSLTSMILWPRDIRDMLAAARFNLRASNQAPPLPGKYSVAQKSIHAVFALVVLAVVISGLLMLAKIDTPFWERDPYFLTDATWGFVYVVHGFAALSLITLVMIHIYFSLRPEKRHYLRSMLGGTLRRAEFEAHHDAARWTPKERS